ncbi:ATP-dependent protease [Agrobacterium phage Atu_ph07]|uniref:ATP-dependent Clp protease adaptor protein n=1 Tax=Agrobacterium phage Atu_ph07 TaxID=2024264 RepID=A0A2L0V0Y2_9CAUD|nr:ATP-dependent protease [Agrobacterium phage Atu_ph07]AUZ95447.1 ATP-dependent Clp protease adaptor protein [Agrobacterium phage Atu_ph07]
MTAYNDTMVLERVEIAEPSLYDVLLHDDQKTPLEFVGAVLINIFGKTEAEAIEIISEIESAGKAVAGTYTSEVADIKVDDVLSLAKSFGFNDFKCDKQKH